MHTNILDLLACPEVQIATTQVLRTYVGGRRVYLHGDSVKP